MAKTPQPVRQIDFDAQVIAQGVTDSVQSAALEGRKNYFINGGMDYAQRGLSTLIGNGSSDYTLDRWICFTGFDGQPASQTTYSRELGSFSSKTKFSLKTTGSYGVNETFAIIQRIESINARELANQSVSFLGRFKTDGITTVKVRLSYANVEDDFSATTQIDEKIFSPTIDLVNNDLLFEDIAMPSNATNGIEVAIIYIAPNTGVRETFLSEVKLNIGETAQDFSLMGDDLTEELKLCQRYFEKSAPLDTTPGSGGASHNSVGNGNSIHIVTYTEIVEKRILGTVTVWRSDGTLNQINWNQIGAAQQTAVCDVKAMINKKLLRIGTNLGSGIPICVVISCQWTVDAEL